MSQKSKTTRTQIADLAQNVTQAVRPAMSALEDKLANVAWDKAAIASAIKEVLAAQGLKMPALAMPVRRLKQSERLAATLNSPPLT